MAVLIKGLDMPQSCSNCNWSRYSFPNAWCSMTHHKVDIEVARNGRPDGCPLIEVPEPHGRLGDLDALFKEMESQGWYDNSDRDVAEDLVLAAPTIIPAEEGEA